MIAASVTLWSRSLTWRLLAPVGLMLLLVTLLTLVSLGTRARLHRAYDAQTESQEVRTQLVEVRSLSRSLQRDALNLLVETDRRELRVIHDKYVARTDEMRRHLLALIHHPGFTTGAAPAPYLASQRLVLDRLTTLSGQAERGDRTRALATFRREVRPNERAASRIADRLIGAQTARVAALRQRTNDVERQEVIASSVASLLLFVVAALATLAITRRSVLEPLSDIEHAMTRIAGGETAGDTPHTARSDEIGRMAHAIEVFRGSMRERERLREERDGRRIVEARQELEREQARRRDDEAVTARSAAGKGFTVVAGEVKQLAGETARATDGIADQIADMRRAASDAGASLQLIETTIAEMAHEAGLLAGSIDEQAHSRRTINKNPSGAVADLDLIDGRVREVAESSTGVETLARQVSRDAVVLETAVPTIDRALSASFTNLDAVRTATFERREPVFAH